MELSPIAALLTSSQHVHLINMSFTETQLKAMAITPKCTSGLSIPGSFFIIYETFCDYQNGKTKNVTAMQRAVVGMSCVDILSSVGWFLSTWAAPEGWALYAVGNDKTCRFQGFLLQIAIGAPMYNGALILYYLLVIKHKYTHEQILHIEPYLHVFIWIWCIGTSIVLLSLDLIDFIGPVCWVSDHPSCFEDTPEPGARCNSKYCSTAFFCVPLWIVICMTIYGLFSIYWEVSGNIKPMSRYSSGGRQTSSLPRSSRDANTLAFRAVAYSVAFIVTWTASTIWSVAQWFDYYPFWVSYTW